MNVWIVVQEVESGADRDEIVAVYSTEAKARKYEAEWNEAHGLDAEGHTEDGDDWCECGQDDDVDDDCDGGHCVRVQEWPVSE